jgi:two-component system nitrogen regulation response regulator GlnG
VTELSRARILIADDEASIRFVLRESLETEGHEVSEVEDGDAAVKALASGVYHLAFLDIRMPGQSGLEILEQISSVAGDTAVVIITAQNTMENAVEAMKLGALDYLVKPFSIGEVAALAEKALRTRALQREVRDLRREVSRTLSQPGERLVGQSSALLEIFKTVGKVAGRNIPVLITGASPRAGGRFVAVNAAAIPSELLESELFGHQRGAFTGAVEARPGRFREAAGGTLFLDEIGDMPMELQAKMLRVLQSNEIISVGGRHPEIVDVRTLAATHRDLDAEVRRGRFREDLLYRLRVVPIHIPPLRDRAEDIALLAQHFVARYSQELAEANCYLADSTLGHLEKYDWPGNVRELENAIKRALVLASSEILGPEDFDFLHENDGDPDQQPSLQELVRSEVELALVQSEPRQLYRSLLDRVERPLLEAVLSHTEGNQIRAAAMLGINRNTLRKKINELGIALPGREDS